MDISQEACQVEYLSFLLRLWRVSVEGARTWRASLQRPGAPEVVTFVDLEAVLAFLRAEMERGSASGPPALEPPGSALSGFPPARE